MLEKLNPTVIGYALNVVGLFFLASAITFKKPRRQIEELLGVERPRSLLAVREQLVNQIQTYIGFVILVVGFVLLMGEALNRQSGGGAAHEDPNLKWIVVVLLVSTLATAGALKVVQLGYVRSKFRRLLRHVVRDAKFNLEKNPQLAVQIGELLNIPKLPDQSVGDYVAKVKVALGIAVPSKPAQGGGTAPGFPPLAK
jgi:hypothetical protein